MRIVRAIMRIEIMIPNAGLIFILLGLLSVVVWISSGIAGVG